MGSIRFCLCGCRSENPFVCLTRNPHKGPEGEILSETGSGRGKEGPREDRESQLTKEG